LRCHEHPEEDRGHIAGFANGRTDMSDRRADDAIENVRPLRAALFDWKSMSWSDRLAWYLRLMACVSMIKGLYSWAQVCGMVGEEGGFEAHVQSWQVATAFFSIIDLVAAVGLWLVAPWGAVVWLTSTVSLIVVHVFMPQIYGTNLLLIGLNVFAITAYLALAVLAAREHPR
jgi:hypothetical protein